MGIQFERLTIRIWCVLVLMLLPLCCGGRTTKVDRPHVSTGDTGNVNDDPQLIGTWINVWVNSNQSYVPGPDGRAAHAVRCAWDVAMLKYNVHFPENSAMTLENIQAVDWVGGYNFGNMYAYIALIQRSGVNTLIPDFTNGFSNANSKFPVELLHRMLEQYFPIMHVVYAVSASSFVGAKEYLDNPASNKFGYLRKTTTNKSVVIAYTEYSNYLQMQKKNLEIDFIFADGESTMSNKGGWHLEPYSGVSPRSNDVFFVAPSLDWQSGTPNASWSVSLPWLAQGLHIYNNLFGPIRNTRPPSSSSSSSSSSPLLSQPWLVVIGSFDDANERNMWMPAVTSTSVDSDFVMAGLDGTWDSGEPHQTTDDWTQYYDVVTNYVIYGVLPVGKIQRLVGLAPASIGVFETSSFATPNFALYVNPPYPFNRNYGNGSHTALLRNLHPIYPPDLIFPIGKMPSVATTTTNTYRSTTTINNTTNNNNENNNNNNNTDNNNNNHNNADADVPREVLQQFHFLSGSNEIVTSPANPIKFSGCQQCQTSACFDSGASLLFQTPASSAALTSTSQLILANKLADVDFTEAVNLTDCNFLGPGISFFKSHTGAAQTDSKILRTPPSSSALSPSSSSSSLSSSSSSSSSSSTSSTSLTMSASPWPFASPLYGLPKTYGLQSTVYTVPIMGGDGVQKNIVYALSTGLAFVASSDFSHVELVLLRKGVTANYLWSISTHPISGSVISIVAPNNITLVWTLDSNAVACSVVLDCIYTINLSPATPVSMYTAFDFK